MAGGKATRLYPMTLFIPKQLIMINGHPVIYYIIKHCKDNGISEFVLCISGNHFKRHFYNALGDGSFLGVKIEYSVAPQSIKTAGRILRAKDFIDSDNFVVYYGDIITNFNLSSMIKFHESMVLRNKCICTLAMSKSASLEVGVGMEEKGTSRIICFKEKPRVSDISIFKVNVGIAVCNLRILDYCTENTDLFSDAVPRMIEQNEYVCSYVIDEPFYDIGTFSNIEKVLKTTRRKGLVPNKSLKVQNVLDRASQ
jgi:NDP-sugar pyrophosphorylase family protein